MSNPPFTVLAMVLFAGILHAGWNAIAKGLSDTRTNFALLNVGVFIFSILVLPFAGWVHGTTWWFVWASVVVHHVYQLVLMAAYTKGEFSTSYPVARGIAPLLVSLSGVVLAHEHLSVWSLSGIVIVAAGISSLSWTNRGRSSAEGITWALATGVAIAIYTVIDGYGVRHCHDAFQYGANLFFWQSMMWIVAVVARRGWRWLPPKKTVTLGALGGLISMVAYVIVMWAQTRTTLGVVSALRETGVLWAAIMGVAIFKEGTAAKIVLPAGVVAVGIAFLALG